jgi:hypothetical protein
MIISYNFNVPKTAFANAGSAGTAFDLAPTTHVVTDTIVATASGIPSKDRGLWFDKDPAKVGCIKLPKVTLHATFSIHFWVFVKTIAADEHNLNTIFSKDRGYGAGAENENNFMMIAIDHTNKVVLKIADYHNAANFNTFTSAGDVAAGGWKYVVVSVEMKEGKKSDLTFFLDNTAESV